MAEARVVKFCAVVSSMKC